MDIKTMTVEALKALAYDQLAQMESCKQNLSIINQEIATRNQKKAEEKKDE